MHMVPRGKTKRNKRFFISATIVVSVILAGGIFYLGLSLGTAKRTISITDSKQILNEDFSLFWEAIDLVKQRHVHSSDVTDKQFLYGAINGALTAFDDPYTLFFEPEDAKKLDQDLSGVFGGIGAEIGMRNDQLIIIAPLKGNPAEEAGLLAGDKILEIDGIDTGVYTIEESVKHIRGEMGTVVKLLIFRDGWDKSKEFSVTRQVVRAPTLDWEMRDNIAYFQIYNFNSNLPSAFDEAAFASFAAGTRGVVLDLRNNPGGFLDVATWLVSWFTERGQIATIEQFASGDQRTILTYGNEGFAHLPVVVLVNKGSASASEIVAGALRDLRKIPLVGETTFGKGSVQEIQRLSDGSTIKVSVAAWLTPLGHEIDKLGLTPDFEVLFSEEDIEKKNDTQLARALELLRELIANKS